MAGRGAAWLGEAWPGEARNMARLPGVQGEKGKMNKIEKAIERMIEKTLAEEIATDDQPAKATDMGKCIVVADLGWVFVGDVTRDGDVTIRNASNIRNWGTTSGLGQLLSGPLQSTKFDKYGTVIIPEKSIILIMPCNPESNW